RGWPDLYELRITLPMPRLITNLIKATGLNLRIIELTDDQKQQGGERVAQLLAQHRGLETADLDCDAIAHTDSVPSDTDAKLLTARETVVCSALKGMNLSNGSALFGPDCRFQFSVLRYIALK